MRVITMSLVLMFSMAPLSSQADLKLNTSLIAGYDATSYVQLDERITNMRQILAVFTDTDSDADSDKTQDVSGGLALGLATQLHQWLIEVEYQYIYRFDLNGYFIDNNRSVLFETEIQTDILSINLGRNFHLTEHSRVELKLGLGRSFVNTETRDWRDWSLTQADTQNTVWQFQLHYVGALSKNWEYRLGYQYKDIGNVVANLDSNNEQTISANYRSHGLSFGTSYLF